MIREMLLGDTSRLRYLMRFPNCRRLHEESVAEHSFFTTLYALFLGRLLGGMPMDRLLMKALIHDVEEAVTGDVPRPFKHSSKEIESIWQEAARPAFNQVLVPIMGGSDLAIVQNWTHAKNFKERDGRVVAFADFLSVLGYVIQEIKGANFMMREHLGNLNEYLDEFTNENYEEFFPYVEEARKLLKEVE